MNWMLLVNAFWFILPAYFANGAPLLTRHVRWVREKNISVDFGKKYKGEPVFGSHKTWFGIVFGIAAAAVAGAVQIFVKNATLIDLYPMSIKLAFVLGFGALFGDLCASFVKRRIKIKSGQKSPPLLDQLNLLFGAFAFSLLVIPFQTAYFLILLIVTPIIHKSVNVLVYNLKLKEHPW